MACFWTNNLRTIEDCVPALIGEFVDITMPLSADPYEADGINFAAEGYCAGGAFNSGMTIAEVVMASFVKIDEGVVCGDPAVFDPDDLIPAFEVFTYNGGGFYYVSLAALQSYDPSLVAGDFVVAEVAVSETLGGTPVYGLGVFEVKGV